MLTFALCLHPHAYTTDDPTPWGNHQFMSHTQAHSHALPHEYKLTNMSRQIGPYQ